MDRIIAILPEEVRGVGVCARVYTQSIAYIDQKSPTHYLSTLLRQRGRSKKLMDKQFFDLTQISRNTPYTIDHNHVFFAFKYRIATYDNQGRGFVNVAFVEAIDGANIILHSKEAIATLSKERSLIQNRNNAMLMLYKEKYEAEHGSIEPVKYLNARILDKEL